MQLSEIIYTVCIAAGVLGLFYLVLYLLKKWSGTKKSFFPQLVQKYLHASGILFCMTVIADVFIARLGKYLLPGILEITERAFHILTIIAFGFFASRVAKVLYEVLIHYYSARNMQDYSLRSARTKYQMIQRILNVVIVTSTFMAVLMTFPQMRQFGNTLLASAGVAGIILGFAAQKSLGTLFSGIQIAIAQPVKLDDVVVVNGQFGTIEEITLTYIVINTWDEKRLIVPINYFLENSFENWTRVSSEVVGTVRIHANYSLPVEEVRSMFNQLLSETPLWDKRKSGLLITGATEKTMELMATMSARDSEDAYQLECLVREKLIMYIRGQHPDALP